MNRGVFWLSGTLVALPRALLGIGTALSALPPASTGGRRFILWPLDPVNVSLLTYVAVGALIASHRPRNPIGWIFCAIGLVWEISAVALAYAAYLAWASPAAIHAPSPLLVLAADTWSDSFAL